MEINSVGMGAISQNSTAESARVAAEGESFARKLAEMKKRTQTHMGHVVNEAAKSAHDKELKNACKEFEAYFLDMMYRQMRKTVPDGGLFRKSNAIEIFEEMRDTEYMKQMANAGGIGIADLIYKQLSQRQAPGA